MSNETVTTTDQTDPRTADPTTTVDASPAEIQQGTIERMVAWMRAEGDRARSRFAQQGYRPGYYSATFELTAIATALGLNYHAVNGACNHLHATGQIIGYRLVGERHPPNAYAIALREGIGEVQA